MTMRIMSVLKEWTQEISSIIILSNNYRLP